MANKVKDLYAILEIERTASDKEIKLAYRKMAKAHHPDISDAENAQEIFEDIQTAYEVLSDPTTRKEYDEDLARSEDGTTFTIKDIYAMFNKEARSAHAPIKGEDVEIEVEFTIPEVMQQATKTIEFKRYVNCDICHGHGYERKLEDLCPNCKGKGNVIVDKKTPFGDIKSEVTCKTCSGSGYMNMQKCEHCEDGSGKKTIPVEVSFQLPKETRHEFKITLSGKGDAGLNGGRNGDLILKMLHSPHDAFRFMDDDGVDIETDLHVSFVTCMTGGKVPLTLPNGHTIDIPINRGTQHGHQVMIPEAGMVNPFNGFRGLLTVHIYVEVPKALPEDKVKKLISILG